MRLTHSRELNFLLNLYYQRGKKPNRKTKFRKNKILLDLLVANKILTRTYMKNTKQDLILPANYSYKFTNKGKVFLFHLERIEKLMNE